MFLENSVQRQIFCKIGQNKIPSFFSICHFAIIYIKNKRIIIIVTNFHTQNLYLS